MSFASLGLSEALVRAIEAAGYTEPTPVQQRAIPAVLQGRDLMVAAQTGTGKTGGFALPILERLFPNGHPDREQRHGPKQPRVLVHHHRLEGRTVRLLEPDQSLRLER